MLHWLRNLLGHKPTIGDYVADSLATEPDEWATTLGHIPLSWELVHKTRGWTLTTHYGVAHRALSFNQCGLTAREKRRIWKALERRSRLIGNRRRDTATRRLTIRAVQ